MTAMDPLEKVFRDHPLFAALTADQRVRMRAGAKFLKLKENQVLFDLTHKAERFFILRRGNIKLFRTSSSGAERIIEIIRPGESFATAVMFMKLNTYPVCASTLKPTHVFSFENISFLAVLRESPETCFRIMADLSQRLYRQLDRIDQLSQRSAPTRLATYLIEQTGETTVSSRIHLDAPKCVIASRLSIKPETFSRALSAMSRKGVINVKGKTIEILNVEALKILASGGKNGCVKCRLP